MQIESNLFGKNCQSKWLVLETPSPEEDIVAAGRLILDFARKISIVDILCSVGDDDVVRAFRFSTLLRKLENIVLGHNFNTIILEVSSWRTDLQEQLTSLGYKDCGGRIYDEEHSLLKPTMILEFRKDLYIESPLNSKVSTTETEHSSFPTASAKNIPHPNTDNRFDLNLSQETNIDILETSCFSLDSEAEKDRPISVFGHNDADVFTADNDPSVLKINSQDDIHDIDLIDVFEDIKTFEVDNIFNVCVSNDNSNDNCDNDNNPNNNNNNNNNDNNSNTESGSMENLMFTLFSALHSEYPPCQSSQPLEPSGVENG